MTGSQSHLPFELETPFERTLAADPDWREGIEWGEPRSGHPEGAVKWHVAEVLANLDLLGLAEADRARLRIAAIVHDTFKIRVDRSRPRIPPNEHGFQAARWLEPRVDDAELVTLVELHDEGYRAWRADRDGDADDAARRLDQVGARLGPAIRLYTPFYWADNRSGDKEPGQLEWFVACLADRGIVVPLPRPRPGRGAT